MEASRAVLTTLPEVALWPPPASARAALWVQVSVPPLLEILAVAPPPARALALLPLMATSLAPIVLSAKALASLVLSAPSQATALRIRLPIPLHLPASRLGPFENGAGASADKSIPWLPRSVSRKSPRLTFGRRLSGNAWSSRPRSCNALPAMGGRGAHHLAPPTVQTQDQRACSW